MAECSESIAGGDIGGWVTFKVFERLKLDDVW
jgi:hypothetical protein